MHPSHTKAHRQRPAGRPPHAPTEAKPAILVYDTKSAASTVAPSIKALDDARERLAKQHPGRAVEVKAFHLTEVKALDDQAGTFEGYLSVFDVVDHGNDVVRRGAFTKTLAKRASKGRKFPLLWYHDHTDPLGVFTEMREDSKGLYVKGELNLETQGGREKYALLKQGAIAEMSIGYCALKWETKQGVRELQELELYEGSLVTFAMNDQAVVTGVKAAGQSKAADFDTTLDLNQRLEAIYRRRWAIESALYEANKGVLDDEALDREGKLAAIDENLGQFHDAMLAWYADLVDLRADEAAAGQSKSDVGPAEFKAGHPGEAKAGRKLSKASRAVLEAVKSGLCEHTKALEDLLEDFQDATEGDESEDGEKAGAVPRSAGGDVFAAFVSEMKAADAVARMKAAQ